jgi:hypothetical protein
MVVVLASLFAACGADKQAAQPLDEPLLRVLVTPWGLYADKDPVPLTLAQLDARLADLEGRPGAVRIERATTFAGQTSEPTALELAKVDRLAKRAASLVREHRLPVVVEAGRMPVTGWASPFAEGER